VQDEPIAILMSIHRMEDVAGFDGEPADLAASALAAHDPQPRAGLGAERQRRLSTHGGLQVEHHWQVHEHHEIPRDVPVVHHHRIGDLDAFGFDHLTGGVGAVVGQVGRPGELIAEEKEFSGYGAGPWMRRHGALKATAEIVSAQGRKVAVHSPGQVGFLKRQPVAGMLDDVGVRRRSGGVTHAGHQGHVLVEVGGPDKAVRIARLAVLQMHGVQHAGPGEPMIAAAGPWVHPRTDIVTG
jgi:hypothetical protein